MKNYKAVKEYAEIILNQYSRYASNSCVDAMIKAIKSYLKYVKHSTDPNLNSDIAIGYISSLEQKYILDTIL